MNQIFFDNSKIKAYECITKMCELTGETDEWREDFWSRLLLHPSIYRELVYYIEHNDFLCEYKVGDMSIIDIFVWQMKRYNLHMDIGKNDANCDKSRMVLDAVQAFMQLDDEQGQNRNRDFDEGMDLK